MALDRKAVSKWAGLHIKSFKQGRALTDKEKAAIRKIHEEVAKRVEHKSK